MPKQVNVHEAKTNFSKLIAEVEAGEEIVIARAGTPILKLVKIESALPPLVPGFAKDSVPQLSDDEWDELNVKLRAQFVDIDFTS
jgi:prevent-host-death family protein